MSGRSGGGQLPTEPASAQILHAWVQEASLWASDEDPQAAAAAVIACSEGVILHRIARHDDTDPRPTLDLVVKAALG